MNLNYLMDHILYQIFKTILSVFKKKHKNIDNPSIRIYVKTGLLKQDITLSF